MSIGLKRGTVRLEEHQAEWEAVAVKTIGTLKAILGDWAVDIQHVGSTSIKWICAKPIIDIAVAVRNLKDVERFIGTLNEYGVVFRRYYGPGQMFFVMGDFSNDIRTHHIHFVEHDSKEWNDYLNFRDYLNAIPEKAKQYESLKRTLFQKYADNRESYTAGKSELINSLLDEAREWKKKPKLL